ncbi:5-oxoprolinase subunit PxpB [Brooklawnia cerclae]
MRLVVADARAEDAWALVHRVAERINDAPPNGMYGAVPTYDSLLLEFDAIVWSFDSVAPLLNLMAQEVMNGDDRGHRSPRRFTLPVVYGGRFGPDLGFVADYLGLTETEVIDLHTGSEYVVRCLGGPAASCMIDGPGFSRPIPRLPDPRLEVPPNAVSVAGVQGVIGPVRSPSGWRLIGQSPVEIMDRSASALVPYRPGDLIRFESIDEARWDSYAGTHLHELAAV